MKIDALHWESVAVTCASDPSKARTLGRCYVLFSGADRTLRIWECDGGGEVMYARAALTSLDSFVVKFEASWFGDVAGTPGFVPVEVVCQF